jgi:hypothetical protein
MSAIAIAARYDPRDFRKWTADQVTKFLYENGLGNYEQPFRQACIDGEVLNECPNWQEGEFPNLEEIPSWPKDLHLVRGVVAKWHQAIANPELLWEGIKSAQLAKKSGGVCAELQAGSALPWMGMMASSSAAEAASAEVATGQAVQSSATAGALQLTVNPAAQDMLQEKGQHQPLNLLCIFGAARQGKSFLMNLLAGTEELFRISNADTPCTEGVDISSHFMDLGDFSALNGCPRLQCIHRITVGFVDAEGQGDRDMAYDTVLVSPVLLTSKVVVFNWKGGVERDTILNKLGVLAWAAKRIDPSGDGGSDGADGAGVKGAGSSSSSAYKQDLDEMMGADDDIPVGEDGAYDADKPPTPIFGHLHLVFRDWNYVGNPESVFHRVLGMERELRGGAREVRNRNEIRRLILRSFESVKVWLLPPPVRTTADLSTKIKFEKVVPDFRKQLAAMREVMAEQMQAPMRFGSTPGKQDGHVVNGSLLAGVMPVLADALNDPKHGSLRPQSCFAEVQKRLAERVVRLLHLALRSFVGTHYTLHTTHYTLHTTHYTLHTTHYTLHTTHYTPLRTTHTHYIYTVYTHILMVLRSGEAADEAGNKTAEAGGRLRQAPGGYDGGCSAYAVGASRGVAGGDPQRVHGASGGYVEAAGCTQCKLDCGSSGHWCCCGEAAFRHRLRRASSSKWQLDECGGQRPAHGEG